ncbi:alpha-L-fucosidase [uncultured Sphaerochaeta sp.]|uniref:alpha-L-fucosidase n=1 Tax=uncultured Sphaerochaeta sp. TaxID=886478 RepID=UPI002A0A20E0|nr:alpha-L-fucosidase [uncultured Sphaerochaeta sp.]
MEKNVGKWWSEGKFGLFIHWGLYSLLAGEYKNQKTENIAEWIMHDLHIPSKEYEKLATQFNPAHFDADYIVKLAKDAGMKYIVFTSKHHEGFALYHSKVSSYNCVEASPFGRDPIAEFRQACDKYGIVLCLYYSQAQDWDDPDGCEDGIGEEGKNFRSYLDAKCIPQIKELLTNYGDLGLFWLDTPMYMTLQESTELRTIIKELQPHCMISGRIGHSLGDYMTTGDNFIPLLPYPGAFEVPATINSTWGYNKYDENWKSPEKILRSLVKIVSRGGNYLLNIGPTGDGDIPPESLQVLSEVGDFMALNGDSIYGTKPIPVYPYDIDWGYFTGKSGKLYIHIFEEMEIAYLLNIANKPLKAYRLSDKLPLSLKERTTCEGDSSWLIKLPPRREKEIDQVICIEIEGDTVSFEPIRD